MSNQKKPFTIRELALGAFEQINELCCRQDWIASRKKILDISHEMAQRMITTDDDAVVLTDKEIIDLLAALRFIQFSASTNTEAWAPLAAKLTELLENRETKH